MVPSTAQARVLVDEWVRAGVRDVVASPGSRNGPLLIALHTADAAGRLRLHMRIDERGAGFLAIGLAAVSGRVVPVVVTSGTAVANLHPAVLEASHTGVGLLVVSTDRPPELIGSGANQTIDQIGIFGAAVRASIMMPLAEDRPGVARVWRAVVARALDRAAGTSGGDPGPVQLNVPLREPLLDDEDGEDGDDGRVDVHDAGRFEGAAWTTVMPASDATSAPPGPSPLAPLPLREGARTLVVAGHGGVAPAGLPSGTPLIAEPSSALWSDSLAAGPWTLPVALDGTRPDLCPEQVIVLGRPTLHRSVSRLLADEGVTVFAVPAHAPTGGRARPGWTDVAGVVAAVGALPDPATWAPDPEFAASWAMADTVASKAVRDELPGERDGPALAAVVAAALPDGAQLVLGASSPVRDLALAASPRPGITLLSARGVSGIDGTVSLATGAALAHPGPTYALMGDLTFLHDASALALGPEEPTGELTIVVANDDGGGIFTTLEQGAPAHAVAFDRVFGTPHGTDVGALAHAHHIPHQRVDRLADLLGLLIPTGRPGRRIVEVPIDRPQRRERTRRIGEAVRAALTH